MDRIHITYKRAVGDEVLLTAFVRDLFWHRKGEVDITVWTNFSQIWDNNPYARWQALDPKEAGVQLFSFGMDMEMDCMEGCLHVPQHYITAWHANWYKKTSEVVPLIHPWPDLHMGRDEKAIIEGKYWLTIAGGKTDMTCKIWDHRRMQDVVDNLAKLGIFCVQDGGARKRCIHTPLTNVLSTVGLTDIRDLINLVRYSEGVICGVSSQMHIAAAFHKPCVVLGGGRESPCIEEYSNAYNAFDYDWVNKRTPVSGPISDQIRVPHRFLHTIGQLDCCQHNGCWRKRVTPLREDPVNNRKLCYYPTDIGTHYKVAGCQDLIQAKDVLDAVDSYYKEGVLEMPHAFSANRPVYVGTPKSAESKPHADFLASQAQNTQKVTVGVCLYGDFTPMHQQCLSSILATVPKNLLDLRLACNQVSAKTMEYVKGLDAILYIDEGARRKYPAMREMFHDPEHPIDTEWLFWFDDDSYVRGNAGDWLKQFWRTLDEWKEKNPDKKPGLAGIPMWYRIPTNLGMDCVSWFRSASWYAGKCFQDYNRTAAPRCDGIWFVHGGFWAMNTQAMLDADVPCARLNHNGGDITIGEQIHQAGYEIVPFNKNKELINTSAKDRRGFREQFPWRAS